MAAGAAEGRGGSADWAAEARRLAAGEAGQYGWRQDGAENVYELTGYRMLAPTRTLTRTRFLTRTRARARARARALTLTLTLTLTLRAHRQPHVGARDGG